MADISPESAYQELEDLLAEADRAGQRYAAAWREADTPRPEAFLPSPDSLSFDFVLLSLISVDRRERSLRGRSDRLEDWLHRFPRSSELIREYWENTAANIPVVGEALNASRTLLTRDLQSLQDQLTGKPRLERMVESRTSVIYRAIPLPPEQATPLGSDPPKPKVTAVKVIRREFLARMAPPDRNPWIEAWLQEQELLKRATPLGLVSVLESGRFDDRAYVRMELVEGAWAERFLIPPAAPTSVLHLVFSATATLQPAHAANLFHGGLRASKILELENGNTKICGMGFVRAFAGMPEAWRRCARGMRNFIAPELLFDPSALSTSCDIYSFGAILYESLSGKPPYGDLDAQADLASFPTNRPIPLSRLNPAVDRSLEQIISKCLSPVPRDRYKNLSELNAALTSAMDSLSKGSAWSPSKWLNRWWPSRRRK